MTRGNIIPKGQRIDTETVRGAFGVALLQAKNAAGINLPAVAERLGKSDEKSARDYIAGTTEMGITALFKAAVDPDLGPHVRAAIGDLLGCDLVPKAENGAVVTAGHIMPLAEVLNHIVRITHPDSDGGVIATDEELLSNGTAIDDAGLAIDELRVALSGARARNRTRPVVRSVK